MRDKTVCTVHKLVYLHLGYLLLRNYLPTPNAL